MSHLEPGDPTNYPTNVTLPDDGDARSASSVNVPFEGLLDRTAFLKAKVFAINGEASVLSYSSTSPTTWTAGDNDKRVRIRGWGAGGGGGGGASGTATNDTYSCG